jgi:hypothetical protein
MKKLFTLLTMLVISVTIYAQIPNPDFANWSSGLPVGWLSTAPSGTVSQTTPGYGSNTYAVKLSVVTVNSNTEGGYISTNNFPISVNPAYLNFWYKLTTGNGDVLLVISSGLCPADNSSTVLSYVSTNTSVYEYFQAPYYYLTGTCTPDSANIQFSLANSSGQPLDESLSDIAIIDDLSFTASSTGIDDVNKTTANLEPCAPNPASDIANIIYSIPASTSVTVALYDIMGRKIETLLDNTTQSPGRYKIPTDVSNLSTGMYFYSLTANGQTYTQKLAVTH